MTTISYTSIRLTTLLGNFDFHKSNLASPSDKYILKFADGLGPPGVDLFMSNARKGGSRYSGRRPQGRSIILRIGLNPNYAAGESVEKLRQDLYSLYSVPLNGNDIPLYLMNNGVEVVSAFSKLKNFEINPFSQKPEVQITFEAEEPYFYAISQSTIVNPSKSAPLIVNAGSATTGFRLGLTFTQAVSSWQIARFFDKIHIDYGFQIGDQLHLSTVSTTLSLYVVRSGNVIPLYGYLTNDSSWFEFYPGDNQLTISNTNFDWANPAFTWWERYWGV